jgi:hypothetical protein
MNRRHLLQNTLMILLAFGLVQAQEARKLELRMQPGESANYILHAETRTQQVRSTTRGDEKRTLTFKSDMKVLLRCVQLSPDGQIHVEITYPDFVMETSVTEKDQTVKVVTDMQGARSYVDGTLDQQSTWESLEKEGRPNLKKLFTSLIEFTLDKTGKVTNVKMPKDIAGSFGGIDVKQFFRQQVIFPPIAVAPGAQWSDTRERDLPRGPKPLGGIIMIDEAAYTYERNETAMEKECARIAIVSTSKPKEQIREMSDFEQTNTGWSLVDLQNGLTVLSEVRLTQKMRGTPAGVKSTVETTGVVNTTLVVTPVTPEATEKDLSPVETK